MRIIRLPGVPVADKVKENAKLYAPVEIKPSFSGSSEWFHFAMTKTTDRVELYINGARVLSTRVVDDVWTVEAELQVADYHGDERRTGAVRVDSLRVTDGVDRYADSTNTG